MSNYYKKNRQHWMRGGKYYYYQAKTHDSYLIINRGTFVIEFN